MQGTQWWWMARSMIFTSSPVESSTLKAHHSSVKSFTNLVFTHRFCFMLHLSHYSETFLAISGNGVVIHLPGLFEEGDKNDKKGFFFFFMKVCDKRVSGHFTHIFCSATTQV